MWHACLTTSPPKRVLFGWLPKVPPLGGPKKSWKDHIHTDLKMVGISEGEWYNEATSRREWHATYTLGLEEDTAEETQQERPPWHGVNTQIVCNRCFKSESGLRRHKCVDERRKPVWQQCGAVQCSTCQRWFRSRGRLAVHRCTTGAPRT